MSTRSFLKGLAEMSEKLADLLNTVRKVKGDTYLEILLVNAQVQLLLNQVDRCVPDRDERNITALMVNELGHMMIHRIMEDVESADLKAWHKTLPADLASMLRIAREAATK